MTHSIKATKLAKLQQRRGLSRRSFFEYQYEGARGLLEAMSKFTDFPNKKVLDLGCGYGGASAWLAKNGLRVIAADNQLYEDGFLIDAFNFAESKKTVVTFCNADAHKLPFKKASFDIIRLDSVLEHLKYPEAALSECRRVLKPEGHLFVSFPLFYSPFGGHTTDYIKIPWLHILPNRWVRWVIRSHKSKPGILTTDYVEKLYMSLNRMTLKRYHTICQGVELKEIYFEEAFYMPHDAVLFINHLKESISLKSIESIKNALIHFNFISVINFVFLFFLYRLPIKKIPVFNEMVVSGIRSVLRR